MMYLMLLVLGVVAQVNAESSIVGCVSANQAKRLNEEIIRMLEATPFVELITAYSATVSEAVVSKVDKCYESTRILHELACKAIELIGQDGSVVMKQFEELKKSETLGFRNAFEKLLNPLIQSAQQIESAITEGNERRLLQLDISQRFREAWMIIRRIRQEHEKTLQSMNVFFKDGIMNKSAEIGDYVRKGNAGNKYSFKTIVDELFRTDEVSDLNKLRFQAYYKVLSTAYWQRYQDDEFLKNYVFSQAALAIRRSKLEDSLKFDDPMDAERYESFTELKTSEGIKKAASLIRDGLAVGYEEAKSYTRGVNGTLKAFQKAFGEITDTVDSNLNCANIKQLSFTTAGWYVGVWSNFHNIGPAIAASQYKSKIETFYADSILSTMNTKSIQPAIKLIITRFPPPGNNPNVQEAYDFLNQFATAPLGGSNINSFNTTMGQVSTYLQKMLDAFRCYRKNFQLMGNIVQGCKDGRKSFDDLYNEHNAKADLNSSKCTEMPLIETPTKDQIQQIVDLAAKKFNFNPDCQQNLQSDDPGHIFYDDGLNYEDEEDDTARPTRLSASQKNMVCNLRKVHSKPDSVIAGLIKTDLSLISAARCK